MGNECKDDVFVLEGVQVATRRNETRVVNGSVGALHGCDFVVVQVHTETIINYCTCNFENLK